MMRLGKRETLGIPHLSIDEIIESFRQVSVEDVISLAKLLFSEKPTLAVVSPLHQEEVVAFLE